MFALAAMALTYFAFHHDLPLALRAALYQLIGKRINGPSATPWMRRPPILSSSRV
ncbi:high-affinity choline transport [Xanthomonas oryzae pv. oryzae PXO99A]|uniref:High-affinity choline transport n=1 Tax=Xanthomonas oryzae pv. oryzae (strain PXO99A) TaxID=360094 RepID=A0A0K0GHG7_XANOP|nr:high-affinity choline transport [Xanthomonas oryzae pv. oryzae PXO99A]